MFEEAVEIGVAAYCAGDREPDDDEVMHRLLDTGVAGWLAERLLMFLPLAFGRRLLPGVTIGDTFLDGSATRDLADEPVWPAAVARVASADRFEVERIGLRSSEVNAVNQALHDGAKMEDLVLSGPAFPVPLTPAEPGDGGVPSPEAVFGAFLEGHGFPVSDGRTGDFVYAAAVVPHPSPRPGFVIVQVDFAVRHPALAKQALMESFAGSGATWREAINRSIASFERASLHPFIAALLDRNACADQVTWERYDHPAGAFDLCLGPQLNMFSPEPIEPGGPLLDRLLRALRTEPLSLGVHGLRVFISHRDGALQTNEVLLDGQSWPGGEAVVAAAPPPAAAGLVARRMFGLLVPVDQAGRPPP